jgi:hypothetical protein
MLRSVVVLALAFLSASAKVRADALYDVGTVLAFSGFDARGSQNPLSGGADLLITRQFNGNFFDFGAGELTLREGAVSLQVSTGGRLLPQFDVALTTAVNAQNEATTLDYRYDSEIGPQSTSIDGSILIDGKFSINALGFYNLTLTSSTRGTVERTGVVTDTGTLDSDVGPIAVSGNIFVDALAVLTDPLFEQTGGENPFSALAKTLIDPNSDGSDYLASLSDLGSETLLEANRSFDSLHPDSSRGNARGAAAHVVVPEPPVLILLLLGLPVVVRRAWRIR